MEQKPCIVQRDRTVLLETAHPSFQKARAELAQYADMVKSPAAYHTYRITPLSLWNAAAAGLTADHICISLRSLSRWELPAALEEDIRRLVARYGQLTLKMHPARDGRLLLQSRSASVLAELKGYPSLASSGLVILSELEAEAPSRLRGLLKQELTRLGYPVLDHVGYQDGQFLPLDWRDGDRSTSGQREPERQEPLSEQTGTPRAISAAASAQSSGQKGRSAEQEGAERVDGILAGSVAAPKGSFRLRDYQRAAVDAFKESGGEGGSGVLVLPCGAGKTIIGLAAMRELQCETLILTSNATSVTQWISELLDKTTLLPEQIGEYTGEHKAVRPVTVATYQILTHRHRKEEEQFHMKLFNERRWGLIIYDEVHLLPAPVFRATADIQATRRLGLTATLVREDGREADVFSLIGPKRYEMPWKALEEQGWIAAVRCIEVKVPLPGPIKERCRYSGKREQYRLAAENPAKLELIKALVRRHPGAQILIIGQYLNQLTAIAQQLQVPLISGQMPQQRRHELYASFRRGETPVLVVSKVANFAVDLPDASVAIEVSGTFGSRQEEAQRLGRILRPKSGENRAYFYTLVSSDSREEMFAMRRQLFLVEQGYVYEAMSIPLAEEQGRKPGQIGAAAEREVSGQR
ncbi:DNA repair helicase XPB [Paenibacillus sp. FSL M8-0334]|uniref:DNA repair helicase XPB n=1 Tax=Paenibacillus sp. FSL M8-0334 TaxID=2921623 RepID=UPI0030F795C1